MDVHQAVDRCEWIPEPVRAATRWGKRVFRWVIGRPSEEDALSASLSSEDDSDADVPGTHVTEELGASFLSRMFFVWYNSMIDLSGLRPLELKHIPRLLPKHEPHLHARILEERWAKELKRVEEMESEAHEPSLTRAMYFAYRWEYLKAFFPRLVKVIGSFVGPWVIKLIVSFIENPGLHSIWWGLFLLLVLALNLVITSIGLQQYWHYTMATSIHMKSGITSLLYTKLLRLSAKAKQSNIAGKLTNLMSADVGRIQDTVSYLHFLWATPMMMIICFVSVVLLMGIIPTLAGFAVFFGLAPVNAFVAWQLEKLRAKCVALTDTRVKATNEIFSTMKTVKVYALEEHFSAKAQEARRAELAAIRRFQVWKAIHISINFTIVPFMTMATFWAYVSTGRFFSASTAFSIISLYYVLKWPFSLLTQVISSIVECRVSIRRIEEFLALSELPGVPPEDGMNVGQIRISDASFSWDKQSGEGPDLWDISLDVSPGTLTCVIGPVGAGKSSLLNVILGEIEKVKGRSFVRGRVCYAPQTPFLLHATVRENITFGKPFEQQRYDETIRVCALQTDFDMLIAGDMTTIGERGINLSGGQKARIAMARAVYSDSDIYLLDDPLSAVDAHVGHKLFNDCIRTMLRHKTVILVTHQLQFVTHGDQLVFMQHGRIEHQGSPQEIKSRGIDIEALIEKFNTLEQDANEEDIDDNMDTDNTMNGHELNNGLGPIDQLLTAGGAAEISVELGASPSAGPRTSSSGIRSSSSSSILRSSAGIRSLSSSNLRTSSGSVGSRSKLRTSSSQIELERKMRVAAQSEAATSKVNVEQREERAVGRISFSVYKFYFGHKAWFWATALILILLHRGVDVFLKVWIAEWTSKNGAKSPSSASPASPPVAPLVPASINSFDSAHQRAASNSGMVEESIESLTAFANFASSLLSGGMDVIAWPVMSLIDSNGLNPSAMSSDASASSTSTLASRSAVIFSTVKFLWVYIIGNLFLAILQFLKETTILMVTCSTGQVVYMDMFLRLLRAPMSFFDTTPKGRIAARFSSDTDAMDNQLGGTLTTVFDNLAQILSSLVSIAMSVRWFVFGIIPMSFGYVNLYNRFINGYRELARLNGTTKAPLFSQFSETLNGLYTLRAYGTQERFVEKLYTNLDTNQRVYFYSVVSARWLGVRMDILGAILISGVASFALFNKSINPGLLGMALSYCLLNTELLNGLIRGISDVESRMNSVERLEQYTKIDVERAPIIEGHRPRRTWPESGRIEFEDVELRYREGLPLVLNGLSFKINAGEKVGIVGRTGAGKSSLLTALLSLAPLAGGRIQIDGVDINEIGVDDLRSKLSIIPQDPVIFDGNIRHNIDPFGRHTDDEIWETLRRVHLADTITELPNGLDSELADEGANFSLGQRQLLCVARAILRRSKILLLDEASSSIDLETDYLLQKTLRSEFGDCTTITIAHRLATIMDSDRVMVLEAGQLKEFDTPQALLSNPNSLFYSLHQQAQSSASH